VTSNALVFRRVSKIYDPGAESELAALSEVSLEVPAGTKVAVTGRSGSGKSTFLHLAAGIDMPSRGDVEVMGSNLGTLSDGERTLLRRNSIGLVFQFFHLLPHLTVRDNVLLPGWIAGESGSDVASRVENLLHRVELGDRTDQLVEKLSGGEQQRVALCRALLRRPKLVLADEPTGNLDDTSGQLVMNLLLGLVAEEGSTLVYVTHSPELASLADRVWHLHSGILEPA
jgi:ABC-type lipoprotein export system ATPase subunit